LACFAIAAAFGLAQAGSRSGAASAFAFLGCLVCALASVLGTSGSVALPGVIGLAGTEIGLNADPLGRWFLGLIGLVGMPVCAFLPGYLGRLGGHSKPGRIWAAFSLLLASMTGVVLAGNAIVFLAFWELMALSSFLLVATDHERHSVRRAAFVYLGATRIGSGFLMAGFLWAHSLTGTWDMHAWAHHAALVPGPATLILIGLLTKAGSWPFHLWLPIAHPTAPAPVSAVMSGVMINTAVYALLRLFVVDSAPATGIAWVLIGLGAVSSFWGAMFALLQDDLKRLLAYSSVENIGLILLGAGLCMLGRSLGLGLVSDLALAACLLHVLSHGLAKSLLFLCAGAVDSGAHTRALDRLGGLIHRMPWTAAACLVGCAAIGALPPLSGFASEWLLYSGLFHLSSSGAAAEVRLLGLLLIGWLGLVGGLALASFAKAFGIAFLGRPRSGEARHASEGTPSMIAACAFLACACLILGLVAPGVLAHLSGEGLIGSSRLASLPLVALTLLGISLLLLVLAGMRVLAKQRPLRRYGTWDCGFGGALQRAQYSGKSFVQPVVRLFGALYRYEMEIDVEGGPRRHFPSEVRAESRHEHYLESKVYSPALSWIMRISEGLIMRLQAGSIHQYLLFMVVTLVLLLWVGGTL
jgi:hydrogenase-4 component B